MANLSSTSTMGDLLPKCIADLLNNNQQALATFGAVVAAWIALKLAFSAIKLVKRNVLDPFMRADLRSFGKWAVITGSTDGIGKGYAFELAQLGFNLVLISRSRKKLDDVAKEIQEQCQVQIKVVEIDFTAKDAIYDEIHEALKDLEIGVLVNNVGMSYAYPQYYQELSSNQKVIDLISVNVTSASMMTRVVLPGMVKRKRGAIINISSSSGLRPTPLLAQYSAAKAYVDFFSRALQEEVKGTGVIVQSVMPFFVATKLSKIRKTSLMVPGPREYARSALMTVGTQERTFGCFSHAIQGAVMDAVPAFLFNAYSKRLLGAARARAKAKEAKTQ